MQAHVNLDALLEKMRAELERAKRFEPLKSDRAVEECLEKTRVLSNKKDKVERELSSLKSEYSKEKDDMAWAKGNLAWTTPLFTVFGILLRNEWGYGAFLLPLFPIVMFGGSYLHSSNKISKLKQEIKPLEEELEKVKRELEYVTENCSKNLKKYSKRNKADWKILSTLSSHLWQALNALEQGDFISAKEGFENSENVLMGIAIEIYYGAPHEIWYLFQFREEDIPCVLQKPNSGIKKFTDMISTRYILLQNKAASEGKVGDLPLGISALRFASNVCHVLHYGDMEEARELLEEAQKSLRLMREEKWDYSCGDLKFFQYLFEFHYFLLKTVVEAYEAETGAVAKLTEEQAKRFAEVKPVEVPTTVEKVSVSAEEPEEELYRGEVRFKMGAMSQERVGTLVITNKRLKLTGKYRLRGMVATVAVKAALRAAGIGEVYEDIPLKDISWLELKKALLGGYYLEFQARGKKFTLYPDAAQHIYNLLKQYSNA